MYSLASLKDLLSGPDMVGVVHVEIDALDALAAKLGYDVERVLGDGLRLVLLRGLMDRGPNRDAEA